MNAWLLESFHGEEVACDSVPYEIDLTDDPFAEALEELKLRDSESVDRFLYGIESFKP